MAIDLKDPEVQKAISDAAKEEARKMVKDSDDFKSMQTKVNELLNEKKTLKSELDSINADKKQDEEDNLAKKGEYETLLKKKEEAFKSQIESSKRTEASLRKALEKSMISDAATKAIADAKGNTHLLTPLVKGRMKLTEMDGKFAVQVLDTDGSQMLNKNGQVASVDDLLANFKADENYAGAFEGSGATGTGSRTNTPGNGATNSDVFYADGQYNRTKFMQLYKDNPTSAVAEAKKHNISIPGITDG